MLTCNFLLWVPEIFTTKKINELRKKKKITKNDYVSALSLFFLGVSVLAGSQKKRPGKVDNLALLYTQISYKLHYRIVDLLVNSPLKKGQLSIETIK